MPASCHSTGASTLVTASSSFLASASGVFGATLTGVIGACPCVFSVMVLGARFTDSLSLPFTSTLPSSPNNTFAFPSFITMKSVPLMPATAVGVLTFILVLPENFAITALNFPCKNIVALRLSFSIRNFVISISVLLPMVSLLPSCKETSILPSLPVFTLSPSFNSAPTDATAHLFSALALK